MPAILIDGVGNFTMHGNLVRIECLAVGANGQAQPSGILMVPVTAVTGVLDRLATGIRELEQKVAAQHADADKVAEHAT